MSAMIQILQEDLQEIFPEMGDMLLTPDSRLQQIPDWDSMSSVNLQVFLEENYDIIVEQGFLHDNTTIGEILSLMPEMEKEAA